jgi:hypothetical protein
MSDEGGWFRGDFHAHTNHSDGIYSPQALVAMAKELGLDFLTITDHNMLSAFDELTEETNLFLLRGIEATLTLGHYNIFGVTEWHEWLDPLKTWIAPKAMTTELASESIEDLMAEARENGMLNSINHPCMVPWQWQEMSTQLGLVDCLEITNDPTWTNAPPANKETVRMWTDWLNAGYRITAIGGSDFHGLHIKKEGYNPKLASPTTWVFADELSNAGILRALQQHHAYMSMGPTVSLTAQVGAEAYMIGDDIGAEKGKVAFIVQVKDAPADATIRLVRRGETLDEILVSDVERGRWFSGASLNANTINDWFRLDVVAKDGSFLVVTNPIYAGIRQAPALKTYGDFSIVNHA